MNRLAVLVFVGSAAALAACSEPPTAPSQRNALVEAAAQPVLGTYELNFLNAADQLVTSLPFGQAVTIQAVITDGLQPAQGGVVTFQYCSLKGLPSDDPTRIDEAPLEACEVTREGVWTTLVSVFVNSSGIAEIPFCCPQFTPVIGFRYKYVGRGSGIKNQTVAPENFNWN